MYHWHIHLWIIWGIEILIWAYFSFTSSLLILIFKYFHLGWFLKEKLLLLGKEGYCDIFMYMNVALTWRPHLCRISTKLGMMDCCKIGMATAIGHHSLVITVVPVSQFLAKFKVGTCSWLHFRSDLHQTWHDKWPWISDHDYWWMSWCGDHSCSGWLVVG